MKTAEQEDKTIRLILKPIVGDVYLERDRIDSYERLCIELPSEEYKRLTSFTESSTLYRFFMSALISVITLSQKREELMLSKSIFLESVISAYEKALVYKEDEHFQTIINDLLEDADPILASLESKIESGELN